MWYSKNKERQPFVRMVHFLKEMRHMDKRQITTIMYLIASVALFLASILVENPLLGPIGLLFLIIGGFHSQARNEKGY